MELCSFWVINPADGQEGKPEPVKLTFFENGDLTVVSLCEDPEYRGAYRLPCGSYSYTGDMVRVEEENLQKVITLVSGNQDAGIFRIRLIESGLLKDMEWDLFYASPAAWKSLRVLVITFGDE